MYTWEREYNMHDKVIYARNNAGWYFDIDYDKNGNCTHFYNSMTDQTVVRCYDELNRCIKFYDSTSTDGEIEFTYHGDSKVIKTKGVGYHLYCYDTDGRLIADQYADVETTYYQYGSNGDLIAKHVVDMI